MQPNDFTATHARESVLATNVVLRNTYWLLSLTLLFSGAMAWFSFVSNARFPGILLFLVGSYGLMFLTTYLRNSKWGLVSIFAFTGFMGYVLGPMLNQFVHSYSNGNQLIATSLGATGLIFMALSAYALITRKDFSFLHGFLFVGFWVLLLAMIGGAFFHIPGLQLAISTAFGLFSSAAILLQTSQIVQGGETNYIMATITLYVSLYNIFLSLLNILGSFNGRD